MAFLQAQLQRQQGMGQSDTVWSGDPLATYMYNYQWGNR